MTCDMDQRMAHTRISVHNSNRERFDHTGMNEWRWKQISLILQRPEAEEVFAMMNRWQVEKEELEALQMCGFTTRQISMLKSLRETYMQDRMDQPALDIRRLEFARFLVATGRLTEEQ